MGSTLQTPPSLTHSRDFRCSRDFSRARPMVGETLRSCWGTRASYILGALYEKRGDLSEARAPEHAREIPFMYMDCAQATRGAEWRRWHAASEPRTTPLGNCGISSLLRPALPPSENQDEPLVFMGPGNGNDGGGMAMGMGMMQRHPEMKGNLNVDPQIDRGGLARVPWVTGDNNRTRCSDIAILLTPLLRDGVSHTMYF